MRAVASGRFVLPAVVLNAAVQSVLVVPVAAGGFTPLFVLGAIVSGLVMLATYAVVVATSVDADGRALGDLLRSRVVAFSVWTVALAIAALIGLLLPTGILGYLVLLAGVYLPIAAMSGARNPLTASFSAIGARPLAYALRALITVLMAVVVFLTSALLSFFVTGWIASAIAMLVIGLVVWWLTRMWARAFAKAGASRSHA